MIKVRQVSRHVTSVNLVNITHRHKQRSAHLVHLVNTSMQRDKFHVHHVHQVHSHLHLEHQYVHYVMLVNMHQQVDSKHASLHHQVHMSTRLVHRHTFHVTLVRFNQTTVRLLVVCVRLDHHRTYKDKLSARCVHREHSCQTMDPLSVSHVLLVKHKVNQDNHHARTVLRDTSQHSHKPPHAHSVHWEWLTISPAKPCALSVVMVHMLVFMVSPYVFLVLLVLQLRHWVSQRVPRAVKARSATRLVS
jgi:hypothetical protein